MSETGDIIYSVSYTTILFLVFILAALLILLFFLYKHLNKESNGKYTVQRIVFREGGLRDRVRGASVALRNHLVQLWPQTERDHEKDEEEKEEEEEENQGQVHSMGDNSSDEDYPVTIDKEQSDSEEGPIKMREQNSDDGSEEEMEPLVLLEPPGNPGNEPQVDPAKATGPIVNLNQFSGSVLWSEEDEEIDMSDVTAL